MAQVETRDQRLSRLTEGVKSCIGEDTSRNDWTVELNLPIPDDQRFVSSERFKMRDALPRLMAEDVFAPDGLVARVQTAISSEIEITGMEIRTTRSPDTVPLNLKLRRIGTEG